MRKYLLTMMMSFACVALLQPSPVKAEESLVLENDRVALRFDRDTGTLTALENKLAKETYSISKDEFAVEAGEFRLDFPDARLTSLELQGEALLVQYQGAGMTVEVSYALGKENHFAEKRMILTSNRNYGLKKVILSQPSFSAADLRIVEYRYPKFGRTPGTEPTCTFFGRTPKGGFFTGVEEPFDASTVSGNQVVLEYAPSLKVSAGEKLECEPVYFGVYQRSAGEQEEENLPLRSESDAMVAMTSTILGPPRHGLVPMACGWHCEMEHGTYASEAVVDGDIQSLDFLAECGIDWLSDCHPWGGETEKMNALAGDDKYVIGPLYRKFLEHAQKVGVRIVMWPTMNNTHPWSGLGKPLRSDKPEWLMTRTPKPGEAALLSRKPANCMANTPFLDWLVGINLQGLATGYYKSWAIDGSFFGDGGWYTSIVPVDCSSDKHDHLPGDSNYACQRSLARLMAAVREAYPQMYVFTCRPPMDLGIWSLENVDACFTLLESGTGAGHVKPLLGLSEQPPNVTAGDQIRTWSRVRVHRDLFPHYMDQPLLFPTRSGAQKSPSNWPRGKIDYIMLSAMSCSPNQLYYMPTKTGIPEEDKAEIRKWLDWGRENVAYLKVRQDLPDWPAAGKVDGSAHICGDQGLVFLFNPNKDSLPGEFPLTEQGIGLKGEGTFKVSQDYPESDASVAAGYGETVRWEVPGETPVILKLEPVDQ
ncbi:MAG: hypothetical protein ABIP48_04080 [Planctomycetota bacterium]